MDLSGCDVNIRPPCGVPSVTVVLRTAVQCTEGDVCLKDARAEPVEMSCRAIAPAPDVELEGAVEHRTTSCSRILRMNT